MHSTDHVVLVTGATGRQGGAVIRHMLPKGWKLRAITRDSGSHAARALTQKGVEVVQGDLGDPSSVARAAAGVYGIYSVQDFWAVGAKREVQQGKNVADAAKKAGLRHLVYSSVGGAERNTGIPHWESKWEIEKHIRSLGLPATVFRPVTFMEGYYIDQVEIGLLKGKLVDAVQGDKETPARGDYSSSLGHCCEGANYSRNGSVRGVFGDPIRGEPWPHREWRQ